MDFVSQITRDDAEVLIPVEEVPEIIQGMTQASVFMQNARRLRNMNSAESELKVLDGLPQAYFVDGDNGMIQATNLKWKGVRIYAEKIACIVPLSDNVLSDSTYDIWGEARPKIAEALAVTFDRATLAGIAAPDRWPPGIIPLATAAGHTASLASFSADEDMALYEALLGEQGIVAMLEELGYDPNGWIAKLTMKSKLRSVKDENKMPVFNRIMQDRTRYELDGLPIQFPKNKPFGSSDALAVTGDWSEAVWSMRADIRYKVFDAGSLQDIAGNTILNLLQQDQQAMRVVMRIGWALPIPVTRDNPDQACPFAVLTP